MSDLQFPAVLRLRAQESERVHQKMLAERQLEQAAAPAEQLAAAVRLDAGFATREKLRIVLFLVERGETRLAAELLGEALIELGDS